MHSDRSNEVKLVVGDKEGTPYDDNRRAVHVYESPENNRMKSDPDGQHFSAFSERTEDVRREGLNNILAEDDM